MADRRKKDIDWTVAEADGSVPTWERASIAVLMDIRDELRRIAVQNTDRTLRCPNFLAIPETLRAIRRNTAKPRKRKKLALVRSA